MGLGGDTTGGGATSFVAFFALRKMGASFLTSSSGALDSELSESESMMVRVDDVLWWVLGGRCQAKSGMKSQ